MIEGVDVVTILGDLGACATTFDEHTVERLGVASITRTSEGHTDDGDWLVHDGKFVMRTDDKNKSTTSVGNRWFDIYRESKCRNLVWKQWVHIISCPKVSTGINSLIVQFPRHNPPTTVPKLCHLDCTQAGAVRSRSNISTKPSNTAWWFEHAAWCFSIPVDVCSRQSFQALGATGVDENATQGCPHRYLDPWKARKIGKFSASASDISPNYRSLVHNSRPT